MMTSVIQYAPTPDEVASMIAEYLVEYAAQLGRPLRLAVSGGSTPASLFRYWLEHPHLLLDHPMHIYWVDERMVPVDSTESNFGNAYRLCFAPLGYPNSWLHPILCDGREVGQIASDYDVAFPGVDVAILGMGEDGHTSSLFPGQNLYDADTDYIASIHPTNGIERVAMSYAGIGRASVVLFHILGEAKRSRLQEVLHQYDTIDQSERASLLPAAYAMHMAAHLRIYTDIKGL